MDNSLKYELEGLEADAHNAISVAMRCLAALPESKAAVDAVKRHAKGLQCAAALIKQQLRYGK